MPHCDDPRAFCPIVVFFFINAFCGTLLAQTDNRPLAAVIPVRGTVSENELKAVAIEIRGALRHHGYRLAKQNEVRERVDLASQGDLSAQASLGEVAAALQASLVLVPVVSGTNSDGFYLKVLGFIPVQGTLRAVNVKLPSRGAGTFNRNQVRPASAVCVASLLHKEAEPIYAPFPIMAMTDPYVFLDQYGITIAQSAPLLSQKKTGGKEKPPGDAGQPVPPQKAPQQGKDEESSQPKLSEEPAEESAYDWSKWDHKGVFADLAFNFSWCRGKALCEDAVKGFGARLRIGYRIASYVAISVTGVARDHQMPLTTDTRVFVSVKNAFVFAGVFGGIRYHPIRRFVIDPFVGIDFGSTWLLHASNLTVATPSIPGSIDIPESVEQYINKKRTTLYLRGFTVAPELGLRIFMTPAIAVGVHGQWAIPFWKKACARVYDPSTMALAASPQVCTTVKGAESNPDLDADVVKILSEEKALPRFIGLELDLVFVFK